MGDIPRVTKQRPCAVCHKPDWCGYSPDGAIAFCMRVPSDRQAANGAYIHVLKDRRDTPPMPVLPPPPSSVQAMLFSAQNYWDRLDRERQRYDIDGVAVELGVDVIAVERLKPRYDQSQQAFAWPMRDGDGKMTGLRLRSAEGDKWAVKYSKEGLFYDDEITHAEEVLVCEGPTDCAACLTLGYVAVGRPSCMGGNTLLKSLLTRWGVKRIVCVADNDTAKRRPDGSVWYPGVEGAKAMVTAMGLPYKMLMTPTKDIRRWVCNGATRRDVDEVLGMLKWRTADCR